MTEKTPTNLENKEAFPKGREIDLYLFRHGEASGEGVEAELTPKGKEQAREAAETFLKQVVENGGGAIKVISSPVTRARQTAEIMQVVLQKELLEKKIEGVRLLLPHTRGALKARGVIGPLLERGIDDPVDHWLKNPEVLKGKSPREIAERVKNVVRILRKTADRLPSGEKIYYAAVTHEVPQAALLNQASGKTLNEMGGGIQNCESMKISLVGNSEGNPVISFRDETINIGK